MYQKRMSVPDEVVIKAAWEAKGSDTHGAQIAGMKRSAFTYRIKKLRAQGVKLPPPKPIGWLAKEAAARYEQSGKS